MIKMGFIRENLKKHTHKELIIIIEKLMKENTQLRKKIILLNDFIQNKTIAIIDNELNKKLTD
jgi:hypothetical protein